MRRVQAPSRGRADCRSVIYVSGRDRPLQAAPARGAADRRRRRHGLADHRRGAAAALPRGGKSARSRGGRLAARQLHQRRRGADRNQFVRRQPPQARPALPRGRLRTDQLDGRQARAGGEGDLGPRRLHRRCDRPTGRVGDVPSARGALQRAGERARRPRRRPVHDRDVLRPRGAGRRDRRRAQRLDAADRRVDDVRRRRRDARRRPRARRRRPAPGAGRRRDRRQPRQRAAGRARGARADDERRLAAGGAAEHRSREPLRRPRDLPARGTGVLRRVRRPRAKARRARDRRLLRHDPDGDRRDPRRRRGGAGAALATRVHRTGAGRGTRRGAARDRPRPRAPRGRVRRLGAARPAARRLGSWPPRGRARPERGRGALRRRERQRHGASRHELADGLGADRAGDAASRRFPT